MTSTPATIARIITADRNRAAIEAQARYERARRQDAARNGYRGPLTRAELGRYGLAQLAGR